jgi:hypothetical protein
MSLIIFSTDEHSPHEILHHEIGIPTSEKDQLYDRTSVTLKDQRMDILRITQR